MAFTFGMCAAMTLGILLTFIVFSECDVNVTSRNSPCYDMGQNDTIGKIELKPSIVLSSDNTNCKNDIQLFHQLFDELSVYRDYH